MIKELIRTIRFYIYTVVYIPHIIAFCRSNERNKIEEDIRVMIFHKKIAYFGIRALVYLLQKDRFYRTMFYTRLGNISYLFKWYAKGDSTFFPCKSVGGGIYIAHPYATILNAKSIGKNFTCRQCTTIGNKVDGRNDLIPEIGDNVTLGANVCIIGDIRIGNNVLIGAGSVVVKNVPNNCVVAGNPARVIRILKSYE